MEEAGAMRSMPSAGMRRWPDEKVAGMKKSVVAAGPERRVNHALEAQFPGVEFNFSQDIEDNVISRTMSKRPPPGSKARTRSSCSATT
jgi:hypothetical protein